MSRARNTPAPLGTTFWPAPTTAAKACKRCGGDIFWKKTPKGHNMPIDADGRPHKCPKKGRR